MAAQSFFIRDYCAAMILDGPIEAIQLDDNFNMTKLEEPKFDSVQGNWTKHWTFNISKYLMTEKSSFLLKYVNYTQWRPDSNWPEVLNHKCGSLRYDIVHISSQTLS